ncbi:crossover junction endonuclease MUS81 [Condylostylus longicornis]|uniref:crossover junction endonuclease MUS81 n=1 Tax=Condylostylus longicornis TaxID=2530218 RepID=UPI00244DBB80|nr:crossover junction endonuclease MUS81 [Condylostylus longicornis]
MSRIEVRLKTPNPLFTKWLSEWLEEAKIKKMRSATTLKVALDSLKRFPLPLMSGRECGILRGFGATLCGLLDQKLAEYKVNNLEDFNRSLNYKNDIVEVANKIQENLRKNKLSKTKSSKLKIKTKSKIEFVVDETETQIKMGPGHFRIILIVDTQETTGKFKAILDETRLYFEKQKISHEVRRLSIGDFAWICRDSHNNELILPYIVERKRMDDFATSIRDGRFHEQKFRLRNSGIQNIIYLIENYGNNQHIGLPIQTLMQAAVNTQLHSGFQVQFTQNHRETLSYLTTLTKILIEMFKDKTLLSTEKKSLQSQSMDASSFDLMKFNEFQENSSKTKNVKVREIFIKQLLQLKSLSIDKALSITEIYPTPKSLLLAYKKCGNREEAEKLLACIPSGKLNRPIGIQISKTIYQFYNDNF